MAKLDCGPFTSHMDYKSRLQFNAPSLAYPLSGIVCTLGPASNEFEVIIKLIQAGMRVIRMNFSHGSHEYHCRVIKVAQQAIECYAKHIGVYKPVAIALDTRGPEIRTGQVSGNDATLINLTQGESIKLSTKKDLENKCTKDILYVDYDNLPKIVKPCDIVYVDDGLIGLRVKEVSGVEVLCEILNSAKLGSHKGVNLPGLPIDLPSVSEKDKSDLLFGVEHNVDLVFASFIRCKNDLKDIRDVMGTKGKHIKIISKIENQQGMQNIDEIIAASDGIMVARGDLGIEIPTEDVLLAQKSIIAKCNKAGKPVICATQMLESMVSKPRPTRAEASDVGNAIFDGADCVMLSGETAKGKYPVECVKCMANICAKIESVLWYEHIQNEVRSVIKNSGLDGLTSITSGIAEIASLGQAKAIIVVSYCPVVAQLLSQYRPRCAIIMLTQCPRVARQSVIFRGIFPIVIEEMVNGCNDFGSILSSGIKQMVMMQLVDVDKDVKLMTVDALQAKKISFRLLTVKHKSTQAKCQETIQAQAKGIKDRSMKSEIIKKCKKQTDKTKSPEQIEKCKKLAERRKHREQAKKEREEKKNAEARDRICKKLLSQAKKHKDDDK
ncbi:pyruvate kinase-like [Drosophila nasuta]|uniref:pyruvate kinase-like n=1 Tax=Drosophila nasuta TaxID=42062 RepID=UPI00295E25FC|nr:pyruvate kinase-like [Drosophila nasuta]XP_060646529.1 pyruvate kinase-like [Drosophila nasuta]